MGKQGEIVRQGKTREFAGAKELVLGKQGGIVRLGKASVQRDAERTQHTCNHTTTEMKASRMAAATPAETQ